jgi:two-component system sensor histidine kinase BaeS
MRFIPRGLRGRLLAANLVVAAAALGTVLIGVSLVGPGYFEEAMGHPAGSSAGSMMDSLTLAAFQNAIRTSLLAATLTALGAAVVVSLALSARIAGPVRRVVAAARRIAQGHYAERVPVDDPGEVGELATAFNQMTGSLEATERRRLQLVGDVAHELRTPLTTLDGYLEGLEDGVIATGPETWSLLRIETGRLTRLVNDLQDLWRAEARELPLVIGPIAVGDLLGEVVDRFAPEAQRSGITVRVAAEASGVRVLADRDRLDQILGNYLANAIRYSAAGSAVTLSAMAAGGEVVSSVADQGPGLTTEQRQLVFERFYRIDPSRSRALGGSGIGLAIARALASAMGGRVWAESDGPGRGATFYVALPTAE